MRRTSLAFTLVVVLLAVLTALVEAAHLRPLAIDTAIHAWALKHRSQGSIEVARAITNSGTGVVAFALTALAGVLAAIWRGRRWWIGPLITLPSLLLVQIARLTFLQAIDRPRPPMADWAASASGMSYPSGHTTTSATVASMFCLAALGTGRRAARLIAALSVVWAVAVGLTRVYLGVHWPTDVVGGWLLATTLVLLALTAVRFHSGSTGQADDHDDS